MTANSIQTVVEPKPRDIGAFEVFRSLPSPEIRSVGPFIFLDQMGPLIVPPEADADVPPHPHIGLATVTWLLDGEIMHRDSIGCRQAIRPGELNWMVAGKGIVHSERTPDRLKGSPNRLFGVQCWLGLPIELEECEPSFTHYGRDQLPVIDGGRVRLIVIAGSGWGETSPVELFADTIYAELTLENDRLEFSAGLAVERAVCVLEGTVSIGDTILTPKQLAVLTPGSDAVLQAGAYCRLMLLGGEPMDGRRHMWWNFAATSRERIERAKSDWREGRFPPVIDDEDDFVPLPD